MLDMKLVGLQWLILTYQDIDILLPESQFKFSYRFLAIWQSCFEEKKNIWNVISVQEFVLTKYISHYIVAPNKPLAPTFLFGINVFSDHTAFNSYSGDHKYKYINFIQYLQNWTNQGKYLESPNCSMLHRSSVNPISYPSL